MDPQCSIEVLYFAPKPTKYLNSGSHSNFIHCSLKLETILFAVKMWVKNKLCYTHAIQYYPTISMLSMYTVTRINLLNFMLSENTWTSKSMCFSILFLKYKFIYFNCRLITLQYCSGFCHRLTWICHSCTCVPHPQPPSHFPPHLIPLGHPSAPALSTWSHASNMDWRFVSHMITYMFQCHAPKSSHPRPLPKVKMTVLYICVSFSVLHIRLLLPSF